MTIQEAPDRPPRMIYDRPAAVDEVDGDLTLEECVPIRNDVSMKLHEILRSIDSIKSQMEWGDAKQTTTDADIVWRLRAAEALRHLRRDSEDYRRARDNLNTRIRMLRNGDTCRAYERAFMAHAKAVLARDVYEKIRDHVNAELSVKGAA
jgi:hypothetical protein